MEPNQQMSHVIAIAFVSRCVFFSTDRSDDRGAWLLGWRLFQGYDDTRYELGGPCTQAHRDLIAEVLQDLALTLGGTHALPLVEGQVRLSRYLRL